MKIILFLLDVGSFANFHYSTKQGRDFIFSWNEKTQRHEYEIPYEEWIANDFWLAKDLLDQLIPVPIFFDVKLEDAPTKEAPAPKAILQEAVTPTPAPSPVTEITPETATPPAPKRTRRKPSLVLNKALNDLGELDDPLEKAALT